MRPAPIAPAEAPPHHPLAARWAPSSARRGEEQEARCKWPCHFTCERDAMLLIPCPYGGPRDHAEFTYGGDATVRRPEPATASAGAWAAYIYLRDNPKGPRLE